MTTATGFMRLKELLRKSDPPKGVLSEQAFKSVLDHECSRADRGGHPFALLLFDFSDLSGSVHPFPSLIAHIARSVRASDVAGIFDTNRVGVILPETDATGAHVLAENIRSPLSSGSIRVHYHIFIYPSLWDPIDVDAHDPSAASRSRRSGDSGLHNCNALPLGCLVLPFSHSFRRRRALDVVIALVCLIVLSPLMLLVSLLIMAVSPGPVIFKQQRLGFLAKPFTMWKFRTMHRDCDENIHRKHIHALLASGQPLQKLDSKKDPRLIPSGRVLRKCFLDELPQLINVLRGEMSLVGPRPCLRFEAEMLSPWQTRRFYAMPGMTGLWQVNGKENTNHLQMLRYDISYTHQCSAGLNLRILFRTFPALVHSFALKTLGGTIAPKEAPLLSSGLSQQRRQF